MTHIFRALVAIAAGALLSISLVTMPAQAAENTTNVAAAPAVVSTTPPGIAGPGTEVDGGVHWWGYQADFIRSETRAIAAGAGYCSAVVGKLPSVPSKILSAGCGLLAVYAGYSPSAGKCLSASVNWAGGLSVGNRNC